MTPRRTRTKPSNKRTRPAKNHRPRPVQTWRISRLHAHPKQAEFFGDVPDAELAAPVHSMFVTTLRPQVRPQSTPTSWRVAGAMASHG
jgi:hypothetical protein